MNKCYKLSGDYDGYGVIFDAYGTPLLVSNKRGAVWLPMIPTKSGSYRVTLMSGDRVTVSQGDLVKLVKDNKRGVKFLGSRQKILQENRVDVYYKDCFRVEVFSRGIQDITPEMASRVLCFVVRYGRGFVIQPYFENEQWHV